MWKRYKLPQSMLWKENLKLFVWIFVFFSGFFFCIIRFSFLGLLGFRFYKLRFLSSTTVWHTVCQRVFQYWCFPGEESWPSLAAASVFLPSTNSFRILSNRLLLLLFGDVTQRQGDTERLIPKLGPDAPIIIQILGMTIAFVNLCILSNLPRISKADQPNRVDQDIAHT